MSALELSSNSKELFWLVITFYHTGTSLGLFSVNHSDIILHQRLSVFML